MIHLQLENRIKQRNEALTLGLMFKSHAFCALKKQPIMPTQIDH